MTSSTTGDRRWGTTRRSGMTLLGKVAVPKPINLPSQRLENQGLDPNVEIVPKGTLSWGSKSSLNAWGTSSLSPRTESRPGSPSHLSNRPSSGGSVTRPSTADSDRAHESSSIAWDSNSRPSSASGVFPSNQASVALQRPHSADTRPGSSQLSRFAEAVSETSTCGQHVATEKLGIAPTKNDEFSLTSRDFPSLGAEKESSEKSTRPQDVGPHARPASSSGRYVEEPGVDCTEEANVRIGDANAWRRDNEPYCENAPIHCIKEGQLNSHGSQSYPNANFPHQYDAWRGPPVINHQGGGWYRGNHPYGAPMGPGAFHMDPFPYYPTQVPHVPGHGAGPRGSHATNEKMLRPPMLDSYGHPRMQARPGFYLGAVPYEGYYCHPMGYGSPSNRDLPFSGRPAGHAYNKQSGQSGYDTSGSSVALEQNESSHSQNTQRQYKVLLKPQDERFVEDEEKHAELLGNRFPNAEKVAQQMHTSKIDRRENCSEANSEVQPSKAENVSPEDPSLIQKLEGLNSKSRTNDGWQNASSSASRDEQESKTRTVNSGSSVNNLSARIPRTGHASDSTNSFHYRQGDPATKKNSELAATSITSISRRSTQQTQGRADLQTKQRVNSEGDESWRKTTVMSGSSHETLATNSESFPKVNVGDSLDSIKKPGPGILVDPNDNQRSTMRELARQRAQQRQKEEEERARDQRAKALEKLEELNRRSQASEDGSVKNLEAGSNASIPDIPHDPGSLPPARMPFNSNNVHAHSSLETKTTVAAADSVESSGESGKTSMQDVMASNADNVGPTYQDNVSRDRDGNPSKQKRLGYKQKQNIVFEKTMAGNSSTIATTEVFDAVPSSEVVNEDILSHNSDMPATSSISTESTFTKRKNSRNGKKKHKVEDTTPINTTRVGDGKETKSGDESIETGRARAVEIDSGSVSVPSLGIKVSGDLSEQISSFSNEESQSRAKNNWKSQHLRRTQRSSVVNKPAEKLPGSNAVIWAPVHPQQKADVSTDVGTQNTVPEFGTLSKSMQKGQSSAKSKRVEIERYVAKPVIKEMTQQIVNKNLITTTTAAAPEMTDNVLQKENCGGDGTGILQPSGFTGGKSRSPSKSRHENGRQGKHGREHGSLHQRGVAASTNALEDRQVVTSNQPIRGTVNYHSSNQTKEIGVGSAKDQTTSNDDGWNDGWYMTPETHYPAAVETEASAPQDVAVGKEQGVGMHGQQHAFRSNYGHPKKANKRDYNKAHTQHSVHGLSQPDLPVALKESHGPGDHVSAVAPNINRTGKYGGRETSRGKAYGSQGKGVTEYEHQGLTREHKMTSAETQAQSQNRSSKKEVQVEQNPNSMFQNNTGQSRHYGRGQESQGGWGLLAQENMHNHNQRPPSNRDRQKQNMHYEYKPVGPRANDGEHSREHLKDSFQTEGPTYREKGQGNQRRGGQKLYQQQRSTAGRNNDHGLTGERN